MKYLLDASSLMLLIKKTNPEATARTLQNAAVLDLTFYEVGNVVWKEANLTKFLTSKEAEELGRLAHEILTKTNRIHPQDEAFPGILEIARKENLSFYDSSYIYSAETNALTLVTEDKRLREKAEKHVEAYGVSSLIS